MKRVLVTGAGGFIGHHLVKRLKQDGCWVRGADLKYPEYERTYADDFQIVDLRNSNNCDLVSQGVDEVYNLAADMGGIGYITAYLANIARNNILINVNMLEAARNRGVKKFLFSSSACVYAQSKQHDANVIPLKEEDAYPAEPERGYGWEKLFAEQMCEYYAHDFGLDIRVVRFHNVYGPLGTYDGGKEKAPAAVSRKIALVPEGEEVEVWGDGQQTRSFMYIDDCVEGLIRLMDSDYRKPLNLGTDELVTIDQLFDKVGKIAGKTFTKRHDLTKPQGVRGRNSDNSRLKKVLGWEPSISLDSGLIPTYRWISGLVNSNAGRIKNFYKKFINTGDLIFDIGANVGLRTYIFRYLLGTKVIAVEPYEPNVSILKDKFGGDSQVVIVPKAVSRVEGSAKLLYGESCSIPSLSSQWIEAVSATNRFGGHRWNRTQSVETTTLDNLISLYGCPDFIKIDVEGFEDEVIAGLSQPVNLSFEFAPEYLQSTEKCIRHLESLGKVKFTYSVLENAETHPEWVSGDEILILLQKFKGDNVIYGDVYARFI